MANNRMYFVHRPTMVGAYLGKRMGWGWYPNESVSDPINALYRYVEDNSQAISDEDGNEAQDDFVILKESDGVDWDCSPLEEGLLQFTLKEKDAA